MLEDSVGKLAGEMRDAGQRPASLRFRWYRVHSRSPHAIARFPIRRRPRTTEPANRLGFWLAS